MLVVTELAVSRTLCSCFSYVINDVDIVAERGLQTVLWAKPRRL